jgi:hypothetical protein
VALRFLTWNINGASGDRSDRLITLLAEHLGDGPALAALQEVKPATLTALETAGVIDWTVFSLNIRRPGKYDRGNRMLGCVLAGRGPVRLLDLPVAGR